MLGIQSIPLLWSNPIIALVIYILSFIIIAFVFSVIDFGKMLRDQFKTTSMGTLLYLIFTTCAAFMVGTFFIVLINIFTSF